MLDQKQIEELKNKLGVSKLYQYGVGAYEVLCKAPGRGEWDRFKKSLADERKKSGAAEVLFRTCCVFPDADKVDAMLSDKPGLAERYGAELVEVAGMAEEIEKKVW